MTFLRRLIRPLREGSQLPSRGFNWLEFLVTAGFALLLWESYSHWATVSLAALDLLIWLKQNAVALLAILGLAWLFSTVSRIDQKCEQSRQRLEEMQRNMEQHLVGIERSLGDLRPRQDDGLD